MKSIPEAFPATDMFNMRENRLLLVSGAAAAARGAFEAGAGLILSYPGSPVVETFEVLRSPESPVSNRCRLAINEHVAYHAALGYSLSGGRSFLIMKHVGLNVASDPAHYSAYTGVRGGMVILVGHDPGATCSTGEFDARLLSLHTNLPILEPGDFQETLDYTREAFTMSEAIGLPVMVFIPSSLCYGMGLLVQGPVRPPVPPTGFARNRELTCVGPMAVERHRILIGKIRDLQRWGHDRSRQYEMSPDFNGAARPFPDGRLTLAGSRVDSSDQAVEAGKTLVIVPGSLYRTVVEMLNLLPSARVRGVYCPAMTFPLNEPDFFEAIDRTGATELLFVEELEGFVEIQAARMAAVRGMKFDRFAGKEFFPPFGHLGACEILNGLSRFMDLPKPDQDLSPSPKFDECSRDAGLTFDALSIPAPREGTFCPGCSHRAFFHVLLNQIGDGVIGGDIGCSSLPPHFSDWLTCMNSGASIAAGVTLAEGEAASAGELDSTRPRRVVSLIGDSTFFHSGLQTVVELAATDSDQVLFVLDNCWTAMTGHQETPSTPRTLDGRAIDGALDIRAVLKALGVKRIFEADSHRLSNLGRVMRKAFLARGFSVVIVTGECRLQYGRRARYPKIKEDFAIVPGRCQRCDECYVGLTCPAIGPGEETDTLFLDPELCSGCSVCRQVCPNGGIVRMTSTRPTLPNRQTLPNRPIRRGKAGKC